MTAGFSGRLFPVTAMTREAWADMLHESGIRPVDGPVVHVRGAFTSAHCDDVVNTYRARGSDTLPSIDDTGVGALSFDLVRDYYARDPFLWQNIDVWFRWFNRLNEALWQLGTVVIGGPAFTPEHASIKMLEFGPGRSLGAHADGTLDPRSRVMGVVVYLTDPDEYEGGDLMIDGAADIVTVNAIDEALALEVAGVIHHRRPGKGDLVFLPGHVEHEVEALTSGIRNVIAIFLREDGESG